MRCSTSIRLAGEAIGVRLAQILDLHSFGNRNRLHILAQLLEDAGAVPHGLGDCPEGLGELERLIGRHLGVAVRPLPDDVEPALRVDVARVCGLEDLGEGVVGDEGSYFVEELADCYRFA